MRPIDGWFSQKFQTDMLSYEVTLKKIKALMALGIYFLLAYSLKRFLN